MLVQVFTDNHIEGSDELSGRIEATVTEAVGRFGDQIRRVEVHLNDTNAHKSGDHDKRCQMEVRIAGHQPISVSHEAASLDAAIDATVEKMERALDHLFDRLGQKKGRTPFGGDPAL